MLINDRTTMIHVDDTCLCNPDMYYLVHNVMREMEVCGERTADIKLTDSPATLLGLMDGSNQSLAIVYRTQGVKLTDGDIESINLIHGYRERVRAILNKGCRFEYHDICDSAVRDNLMYLDGGMPQLVATCLLLNTLAEGSTTIAQIVQHLAAENPYGYTGGKPQQFYEHKMKHLLVALLFCKSPVSDWFGKYDVKGDYFAIHKDGTSGCYHFYNRNDVEDYLYNNTRFERGSRTRHGFGSLYRGEDGEVYIKLNLQIRFKK